MTIRGQKNQSSLKEISPGCSLEGMMLKLKLQHFGHLMGRVDSLEKTLMLGGIGGRRRRGRQDEMAGWHHRLNGRQFEWILGVGDGQGGLTCCNSWGRKDTTEQLNWTELNDLSQHSWTWKLYLMKNIYIFYSISLPCFSLLTCRQKGSVYFS